MAIKSLLINHLLPHDGNIFHVQVSLISSRLTKEMSEFGVFLVHILPYLDKKGVLQSTNLRNQSEYGKIQPNKNSEFISPKKHFSCNVVLAAFQWLPAVQSW